MFFDILYNILIYPIEFIIEILFYSFNIIFQLSYGVSLFLLSLCINFLSLPLYNVAESWQAKERAIQDKMKPMIDNIKAVYKGDQRYLLIRACQRINGYKTIYAFRGTLGLLIQIPFFISAYNFVHGLTGLINQSFLFIKDLAKPDALIHIGSFSINLLPFIMTLFSILAGFVYARKLKFKESIPLYVVSLIFLVLLYNSPSGLLFYWTINCLFSLIKNIVIEFKLLNKFKKENIILNHNLIKKIYTILLLLLTSSILILSALGLINRKGFFSDFYLVSEKDGQYIYNMRLSYYDKVFRNSDIYSVKANTKDLDSRIINIEFDKYGSPFCTMTSNTSIEEIGTIEVYYKLYVKLSILFIYFILLFLYILLYKYTLKEVSAHCSSILKSLDDSRMKLLMVSCLVISILSGLFIPSSLIGNSPSEFKTPFNLILNSLSMSIGLFLFYPLFIYLLFTDRIKNIITLFFICLASIVLIDTFVMVGNYLNINADFIFDNSDLLKASSKDIAVNILLILSVIVLLTILLKKKKSIIINLYIIIIFALISVSIFDIFNIAKSHKGISKIESFNNQKYKKNDNSIFNISKTGNNIFVFILDKAANPYWLDAIEKNPEYKEKLDGFVIYPNTVSFSASTTTIASLYGGYDYLPYELSTNGSYSIKDKHNEALLMVPLALSKYGYRSAILDPEYVNLSITSDLSIFDIDTNVKAYRNYYMDIEDIFSSGIDNKYNAIRFSIFRMLPIHLRYGFYANAEWFNFNTVNLNSSIRSYNLLKNTKNFINICEDGDYYNILLNLTTHEPQFFASDYLPHYKLEKAKYEDLLIYKNDLSVRYFYANMASINFLIDFIEFLKGNNVYNNTKIILVSDHSALLNTSSKLNLEIAAHNALLIYKDFNSTGNIKIDSNFMTIADMPYIATKHIPNIKNTFNNKIITNDYKTNGAYIISFLKDNWRVEKQLSNSYNFGYYYHVKDNIFDTNNWKKFEINLDTKESKEVEF